MTPWMHSIESKGLTSPWTKDILFSGMISLHSKLAQRCQKNSFFTPSNLICSYYAKKVDLHCQSSDQVSLHSGGLFQESPIHCLLCPHTCRNTDLHTCHPSTILLVFTGRCKIHWTNIEEKDKQERVLHILHDWRANQETEPQTMKIWKPASVVPFVDHLKASPLNKIAKLWTTGEYHATQFPYNLCKVQNNINKKSLTAQE
jgi:hypothetical protein